jgi:O-antigen ligase
LEVISLGKKKKFEEKKLEKKIEEQRLNEKESVKKSIYYIIPIVFIIAVVPLIVYLKLVDVSNEMYEFWNGSKQDGDFFSYYKMLWFLIGTFIAIFMLIIKIKKEKFRIKKTYIYIPIGIYTIFSFLSTVLSNTKGISFFGFLDRYEGIFVLIAYMLVLFISINLVNNEKQIKFIIYALMISALVIGVIGIFQYFGHDFFQSDFGKAFMLPGKYEKMAEKLKFSGEAKSIYGTLFHYNYFGSYMAMVFPISFIVAILEKSKIKKITFGLLSVLLFANLLVSRSRAGVVGGVFAGIMIVIMLRKQILDRWKIALICLTGLIFIFIGLNIVSSGSVKNRIASIFNGLRVQTTNETLKDIIINGNNIKVITSNNTLNILVESSNLFFTDENNIPIEATIKSSIINLTDKKYEQYQINLGMIDNKEVIQLQKNNIKVEFTRTDEGIKVLNYIGDAVDIKPVEKWGFEGREKLGSARGYIWSRSIPLLKNALIVGYGPDTFITEFPQNDIVGKIIAYDNPRMIVDKPHNLFLQIGLNTGVISLIAILIIFIMYFVMSIKIYIKNVFNDFSSVVGLGIFAGFCGYIGAAFFNDSVVSVAPVFWVLLGVGISINMQLISRKNKENIVG